MQIMKRFWMDRHDVHRHHILFEDQVELWEAGCSLLPVRVLGKTDCTSR